MADAQTSGAVQTQAVPGDLRVERALFSVFDKRGRGRLRTRAERARRRDHLDRRHGAELAEPGIEARPIEDYTGFPEILDGRVKTLHPSIYAGLLAVRSQRGPPRDARRARHRARSTSCA